MKGPQRLDDTAGRLKTRMGGAFVGTRVVFRGTDLHVDLKEMDWVGLYVFGITGRRLSRPQIDMLNSIWVYTSYPDARLWNNRVAALAGSVRSTGSLGIAAAIALSEATIYGGQAGTRAFEFLTRLRREVDAGADLEEQVRAELAQRRIYGYGRPINSTDERIPPLMAQARRLGLDQGPHVRLAFEVERILVPLNAHLRMNFAALYAAFVADMGLSQREYQLLRIPTFLAGMPPCHVEAAEQPAGTLFPLACRHIRYEGVPKRSWGNTNGEKQ